MSCRSIQFMFALTAAIDTIAAIAATSSIENLIFAVLCLIICINENYEGMEELI